MQCGGKHKTNGMSIAVSYPDSHQPTNLLQFLLVNDKPKIRSSSIVRDGVYRIRSN